MTYRGIISFLTHDAPDGGAATLAQVLDARVREGELVEQLEGGAVRCFACGHRCLVRPGRRGICKVRFNKDGTLYVPAGYVAALQSDPTEKKPFFHVLPGSDTLTFGMLGCDFHCGYCQNWLTSQALRDDAAGVLPSDATPEGLVRLALRQGARLVGSSYNEPLITAEWAVDVFKVARANGLKTAFISNGNATSEVLDYIRPWTDCYKIDFKAMDDKRYRELGGVLQHVLDAIRMVYERGLWLELVTLIVPGFNDDPSQLARAADSVAPAGFDAETFDPIVESGVRRGAYPGAALVIGRRDTILFAKGYGHLTWSRASPAVDPESTLYDLASVTKVIATTTSVMILLDRGRVTLDAPIATYLPALAGTGTGGVTVQQLLAHTSGLRADIPDAELKALPDSAALMRRVFAETPRVPPGTRVIYSDLNATLLGEGVRRAAGEPP